MNILSVNKDSAAVASLSQLALRNAIGQLGQSEEPKGSNKGPMVNKYLAAVGLPPGYSWCQAFVYWCYEQAAQEMKRANPVIHTAGVIDCWNKTAVHFKMTHQEVIKPAVIIPPGSQFILDYGKGQGHTGLIERVQAGILHTIEGNSNTDGSREGYEVVRHQRKIDDKLLKGIIIYS